MLLVLYIILAVYLFLILNAVAHAMLQGKEPTRTLAWTLVILSLPIIGVVFYYYFGQNLSHEYRHRRRLRKGIISPKMFSRFVRQGNIALPPRYESLVLMEKRTCFALPHRAHHIEMFTDGVTFLDRLIADIRAAHHHVHLEFFIFAADATGQRLRHVLEDTVQRGVQVRLIYDHVGSWSTPRRFFRQMQQAGVLVEAYEPVHFRWLTHRVNYRNHRKICIIDGKVGYVGGMNVADRYVYGEHGRGWRDIMLRCQGTAVYGIQQLFLQDWYSCTHEFIASSSYYPLFDEHENVTQGVPVQVVSSEPFARIHNIMMGYNYLFHNAHERILIQTPYFLPTQSILESLQTAAQRGVRVQIMVPAKMRSLWMQRAVEAYYSDVLEAGIEIYIYQQGFLHAKTLIIDRDFCSVGSVNMDYRSLLDTFEDSMFIYDSTFCQRLSEDYMQARNDCLHLEPALWRQRSHRHRFAESFTRLFAPLM